MDGLEIAHRRLHNQHLGGGPLPDPVAVVAHFGAMQAQEYAVAKWSIAQRTAGIDDATVQRAIDDGAILRTHALRPTWHFVAAADIAWLQALTGPRVHVGNAPIYRQHGPDEATGAKTSAIIAKALRGGNYLTRAELAKILSRSGYEASGIRLAYTMMRAELDGLVANGPMRGKQHTYALISERAPSAAVLEPDEALAELTRRYFTSHGPATMKDFAWWSSLTMAQIRRGLHLVGSDLENEEVDGRRYWFAPAPSPPREPVPTAHVLQGYDEYVVAYSESRYPVANVAGLTMPPANDNVLTHPIIVDSQLVGFWRRIVGRESIVAEARTARRLTAKESRAIGIAFDRFATVTGVPVTITWPEG